MLKSKFLEHVSGVLFGGGGRIFADITELRILR